VLKGGASRAELVLCNGPIYSADEANNQYSAVAVGGGQILALGNKDDIDPLIDDGTQVVDLAGRSAVPGIVDSHNHLPTAGAMMHDGILLFEVTNDYVWSKATENPEELEAFFEEYQDRYDAEELSEIRGTVIADYQNHLEEKWLETLHDTYDVWVDEELLQQIDVEK